MNLRSITGFVPHSTDWRALRDLFRAARVDFADAGLPLQTVRAATSITEFPSSALLSLARQLQAEAKANEIDYVSLGAFPGNHPLIDALPAVLAATETIFASAHIATRDSISFPSIINAARVMHQLAHTTADGFGNLRFAALANCPPHSPFFPAAYHAGGAPAFAIATEAAPHPDESKSIGAAIEQLIGAKFGEHGTLFAAAFITDCINRANFPRVGFSGLMLPVLEDATLAARSSLFTVDSLLLYSAVCGTGLDTLPLPGDTTVDALAAILLDLATLAVKLNKPLTARLMPIPGLAAGDMTPFNFEYFANARVMNANASALNIFGASNSIQFVARQDAKI